MGSESPEREREGPSEPGEASSSSSPVAISALAQTMSEGPRKKDLAAAAICEIKRRVRQNSHKGNGCMVKPVNWNKKFKPRLGCFQEFLQTRKDQFSVLLCQDKLGFTVKDVTGNKTVAPTSRLIVLTEGPKRRSIIGDGLAQKLLEPWEKEWRRGEGGERKEEQVERKQVVAGGRRRSRRSRHPRPQEERRRTRERPSPEDAGGSGGSGDIRLALGNWVDTFRSTYEVQLEEGGMSCSVKTTRPDGTVRRTRGLIHRLPCGFLGWGHSHVVDMGRQLEGQLRWLSLGTGSRDFVWKRP